jgi:predicted DNA-binding transcriptional regulator YafY
MRTPRLLDLLQALRRRRRPVSAETLAAELEVSLRTLYRDVATLRAQGAEIRGEPGVGYVLRPSFFLPPLMLSEAETEALMLGMRWVSTFADKSLAAAAADALAKIEEVLPKTVRDGAGAVPLRVGAAQSKQLAAEDLSLLRDAIRRERKLEIVYRAGDQRESRRVIWPFAIGYFTEGRVLVGYCEARRDYRHFRSDRIAAAKILDERYPRSRAQMFREWQKRQLSRL